MAPKRAESDTDAGRRERCHAFAKLEELPVGSGIWLRFWKPEFGEIGGPGVGRGLPEAVGSVDAEHLPAVAEIGEVGTMRQPLEDDEAGKRLGQGRTPEIPASEVRRDQIAVVVRDLSAGRDRVDVDWQGIEPSRGS